MPLSAETESLIAQAGASARADGFVLVGVSVSPTAAELGIFSSECFPAEQSVAFIRSATDLLMDKADSGELESVEGMVC